jgi:hypothetical protein
MIRIRTKIGAQRVLTIFHNGWVTFSTGQPVEATCLFEAGQNHLRIAKDMQAKLDKGLREIFNDEEDNANEGQ